MTHHVFRFLLGLCIDARRAAMAEMSAVTSEVSGVPLDPVVYGTAKARYDRSIRLAQRLHRHFERGDAIPEPTAENSALETAWRTSRASSENVVVAGVRCVCELDETAVRVHLALCYDVAWSSQHPTRSDNAPASVRTGAAESAVVGFRPSDPPKWAREYAQIVQHLCEGAGCARHFTSLDLDRDLGKPVFTSSDPEKMAENVEATEQAAFDEARARWSDRFEGRGEDAECPERVVIVDKYVGDGKGAYGSDVEEVETTEVVDVLTRQRQERRGTGREQTRGGDVTVSRHEGSMRKRWATETPKGRRWVETRQRIEKTQWQEFYRLARALGRNPATPAAKGWVETVGMDAALKTLRAAVEKQPVAA